MTLYVFFVFFVVVHVFCCVFLIAHYFQFFSYIFDVFLLIASFPPEKNKSLLYKIRNPPKKHPPSIKSENVLSRLNLGPIQKHTKTYKNHVKNMLKTMPLN